MRTPIPRCELASAFTQAALHRYPVRFEPEVGVAARMESLAVGLERVTVTLLTTQGDYRTAVVALVPIRVDVKLVDLKADDIGRSVKRAADEAGKEISAAVFPGGLTPIIKPFGHAEVDELHTLEGRIAARTDWTEGPAQRARVEGVRTEYETALRNRKDAMIRAAACRAIRDAAKEDFVQFFASLAGALQEIFGRDRARRAVFFDDLTRARKKGGDDPTGDGE